MLRLEAIVKDVSNYVKEFAAFIEDQKVILNDLLERMQKEKNLKEKWLEIVKANPSKPSMGKPIEEPLHKVSCPERPQEVTLCAVDGSQVFPDRHQNIFCMVINIGKIVCQIGTEERAVLQSDSSFHFINDKTDSQDVFDADSDEVFHRASAFRSVREINSLVSFAKSHRKKDRDLVAVLDGTLICWSIKKIETRKKQFIETLEQFRENNIPVVSYISHPSTKDCTDPISILLDIKIDQKFPDRVLWRRLLQEGERSAVFESRSEVMSDYKKEDQILFCYLKTDKEIARIEFPRWVYEESYLPLLHSVLIDNATKGKGYPIILSEAHEQAVIRQSESKQFFSLVDRLLTTKGLFREKSIKQFSKENVRN